MSSSSQSNWPCRFDRISGMTYGLAIGDALGAPHEFFRVDPKLPYTGIINDKHTVAIQFQFAKMYLPPATVTDDTMMSLALLETLLDNDFRYDEESVCLAYWRFANAQKTGLGRNTRALFKFKCQERNAYKGYLRRYEKGIAEGTLQECQSNGSLMRSAPLILAREGLYDQDYAVTNPNPVNESCYQVHSTLMKGIYEGKSKAELMELVSMSEKCDPAVKDAITDALSADDEEKRDISGQNKGWVCHCLYAALKGFFRFEKMEQAMDYLVQIPNSDCDTNASVCGGLWGAYLGKAEMMKEKKTFENVKIIESVSQAGKHIQQLLSRIEKTTQ